MNPHNHLIKTCHPKGYCGDYPPHEPTWECMYCGDTGTMAELRSRACGYEYPPCEYCGQTPECAPDCRGIALVLSDPRVHLLTTGSA